MIHGPAEYIPSIEIGRMEHRYGLGLGVHAEQTVVLQRGSHERCTVPDQTLGKSEGRSGK